MVHSLLPHACNETQLAQDDKAAALTCPETDKQRTRVRIPASMVLGAILGRLFNPCFCHPEL